ncbi:MAG: hypothetical protein R3D66_00230 [Alphaproteobacteria bacterium]
MVEYKIAEKYETAEEAAAAQDKLLENYKGQLGVSVLKRIGGFLTSSYLRENMETVRGLSAEYKTFLPPDMPEVLDKFEELEKTRLALLEKGLSGEAPENTQGSGPAYATSTLVGVGPMGQLWAAISDGTNSIREWWRERQDGAADQTAQEEPDMLAPSVKGRGITPEYSEATDNNPARYRHMTFGGGIDLSELNSQPEAPKSSGPSATEIIEARHGPFSP